MFCLKVTAGGIFRAKQHQIEGFKNASTCSKIPPNIKDELMKAMNKKQTRKVDAFEANADNDLENYSLEDDNEVEEVQGIF